MKAGYLQFDPGYLQVSDNLASVERLLADVDADLIVLPELFTSGYFFRSEDDLRAVAEPIPGGTSTQKLKRWARDTGTTLVAGLPEKDGDHFFNSSVLVRPDGTLETYRKVHLFYEETTLFEPGDLGLRVFEASTREGLSYNLGMMVCFDWYFPEAARTLALRGADVIAHPSNLVLPYCPDSMPVRARENHVFTITSNRYGTERKDDEELTFIGMSEICGPNGDVLARADREGDAISTVTFDPLEARDRSINPMNDVLGDRRPDVYARE